MESAAEILVIILAVVLSIFLISGIALIIAIVRLIKTIQHIAETADSVVDKVGAATEALKKAAGPLAAGKFVMNVVDSVISKKKGRGK